MSPLSRSERGRGEGPQRPLARGHRAGRAARRRTRQPGGVSRTAVAGDALRAQRSAHGWRAVATASSRSVEEYEPGRRVTFRFRPGLGLGGTHGFEIEPLGLDRPRLTRSTAGSDSSRSRCGRSSGDITTRFWKMYSTKRSWRRPAGAHDLGAGPCGCGSSAPSRCGSLAGAESCHGQLLPRHRRSAHDAHHGGDQSDRRYPAPCPLNEIAAFADAGHGVCNKTDP